MANWSNPVLSSAYSDFLTDLKARDTDAITWNPGTNIPTDSKRWSVADNRFQNWNGSGWVDLVLGIAGGGTGAITSAGARANLGIGSMGTQENNNVTITGGSITGVNIAASAITSGTLALARGGTGASLALGADGHFLQSNGSAVVFGVNGAQLTALNASNIASGSLAVARMPTGGIWALGSTLTITTFGVVIGAPTGGGKGAGTINATGLFINNVAVSTDSGIPSGLIALFDTACPSGWTRFTAIDGRTLRGAANYGGTGGAENHLHGITGDTGPGGDENVDSSSIPTTPFPGGFDVTYQGVDNNGDHIHTQPAHVHSRAGNSELANSWPPYIDVVFCKKD